MTVVGVYTQGIQRRLTLDVRVGGKIKKLKREAFRTEVGRVGMPSKSMKSQI